MMERFRSPPCSALTTELVPNARIVKFDAWMRTDDPCSISDLFTYVTKAWAFGANTVAFTLRRWTALPPVIGHSSEIRRARAEPVTAAVTLTTTSDKSTSEFVDKGERAVNETARDWSVPEAHSTLPEVTVTAEPSTAPLSPSNAIGTASVPKAIRVDVFATVSVALDSGEPLSNRTALAAIATSGAPNVVALRVDSVTCTELPLWTPLSTEKPTPRESTAAVTRMTLRRTMIAVPLRTSDPRTHRKPVALRAVAWLSTVDPSIVMTARFAKEPTEIAMPSASPSAPLARSVRLHRRIVRLEPSVTVEALYSKKPRA
mmetsp:Transcript_7377/g.23061  ORF Transcript_7377/g.23061 Transcript_7377/m.23061 type:complete len:317 (-) Transcript_7377:2360-3310(-)